MGEDDKLCLVGIGSNLPGSVFMDMGEIQNVVAARVESTAPSGYRLVKKKDGEFVLQGAYEWHEGLEYGYEWRDIPTIDEEDL